MSSYRLPSQPSWGSSLAFHTPGLIRSCCARAASRKNSSAGTSRILLHSLRVGASFKLDSRQGPGAFCLLLSRAENRLQFRKISAMGRLSASFAAIFAKKISPKFLERNTKVFSEEKESHVVSSPSKRRKYNISSVSHGMMARGPSTNQKSVSKSNDVAYGL